MPFGPRPVYQERTSWAPWIAVVLWVATAMSAVLVLVTDDIQRPGLRMPIALGVLAFGAFLQWFVGGLRVRLHRDHLEAALRRAGVIRTRIPYDEISETRVVVYSPIADFGGWGFRWRGDRRAWTARGDEAVVLRLSDGREIFIGSDHPGRLRERILAVAGTRLGRAAGGSGAR